METLDILRDMAMQIEEDWNKGHLVDVLEHDIGEQEKYLFPIQQFRHLSCQLPQLAQSHRQYGLP